LRSRYLTLHNCRAATYLRRMTATRVWEKKKVQFSYLLFAPYMRLSRTGRLWRRQSVMPTITRHWRAALPISQNRRCPSFCVIYSFIKMQAIRVLYRRTLDVWSLECASSPSLRRPGTSTFRRISRQHPSIKQLSRNKRTPFSSRRFGDVHAMSCL
jgi:hypothetical protein